MRAAVEERGAYDVVVSLEEVVEQAEPVPGDEHGSGTGVASGNRLSELREQLQLPDDLFDANVRQLLRKLSCPDEKGEILAGELGELDPRYFLRRSESGIVRPSRACARDSW